MSNYAAMRGMAGSSPCLQLNPASTQTEITETTETIATLSRDELIELVITLPSRTGCFSESLAAA